MVRGDRDSQTAVERARTVAKPTRSILVVDDYGPNLDVLTRILDDVGDVVAAENGHEALYLFKTYGRRFDAIVSDVDMPVMDGLEFFRQARDSEPCVAERFVFLTGCPTEDRLRFFEENGLRYLTKPARADEILAAVESVSRGRSETCDWFRNPVL